MSNQHQTRTLQSNRSMTLQLKAFSFETLLNNGYLLRSSLLHLANFVLMKKVQRIASIFLISVKLEKKTFKK